MPSMALCQAIRFFLRGSQELVLIFPGFLAYSLKETYRRQMGSLIGYGRLGGDFS